jgi:dUTP pyrophosphatase
MERLKNYIDGQLEIGFMKLSPNAIIPERAHEWDAGYDMTAISKKETPEYIQYGTGLSFDIPKGYVGLIFPRSSVTKKDLMLKNAVGVIDSGYIGEVSFRFYKIITKELSSTTKILSHIKKEDQKVYEINDKIGQIIFMKLPSIKLVEVEELSTTERGSGGFGSTDKK